MAERDREWLIPPVPVAALGVTGPHEIAEAITAPA